MAISRKYFHDHYILLLLSINIFLCILVTIFILIRLSSGHSTNYIIACRDCSDKNAVKYITGSIAELYNLIVFSIIVLSVHISLSIKSYAVNRQLAVTILSLGVLLQVLALAVSNFLTVIR
jgi:hypothetical protein